MIFYITSLLLHGLLPWYPISCFLLVPSRCELWNFPRERNVQLGWISPRSIRGARHANKRKGLLASPWHNHPFQRRLPTIHGSVSAKSYWWQKQVSFWKHLKPWKNPTLSQQELVSDKISFIWYKTGGNSQTYLFWFFEDNRGIIANWFIKTRFLGCVFRMGLLSWQQKSYLGMVKSPTKCKIQCRPTVGNGSCESSFHCSFSN